MSQPDVRRFFKHGTLPQLRLFDAIARLGTFARAAQELHMAQPTASLQIKKLTATVGVPLFEQVGKRVHLTEAGRRLHESCAHLFRVFHDLERSLSGLRTLDSGRLRLAVSTTGMSFASRLLGSFAGNHPGVEISMQAHNRRALVERLANNLDDLYLFTTAPEIDGVVTQEILSNPFVVLARDDHLLASASDIPFERLAHEPFLIREEGSGARRMTMRLFGERGLAPRIFMELGTNEAIKEAILAGLGVTIISRHTFGLDPESSRYRCLDVEGFPVEKPLVLSRIRRASSSRRWRRRCSISRGSKRRGWWRRTVTSGRAGTPRPWRPHRRRRLRCSWRRRRSPWRRRSFVMRALAR
jgi:DNA-binding transcriptional LysR family regulator